MRLILLAGNSVNNRAWIEGVEAELRDLFDSTYIHIYNHWINGGAMIDLETELKGVFEEVRKANDVDGEDEYIIFGKSAGVILTLKGVYEGMLTPRRCMFLGTPVEWARDQGFEVNKWIEDFSVKSYFLQNRNDPAMNALNLKEYLATNGVKNYDLVVFDGEDHHYPNIKEIKELMTKLIS